FIDHVFETRIWANAQGFITFNLTEIRAPLKGYVKNIEVRVGQPVTKNTPLIVFESYHDKKKLVLLKAELSILERQHQQLLKNINKTRQQSRVILQKDLKESIRYYKIFIKERRRSGTVNAIQENDARQKVVNAKIKLKNLDTAKIQVIKQADISYDREIRKLKMQMELIEYSKEFYVVRAPVNCVVTHIMTHKHEFVLEGMPMMKLALGENMHIRAYLPIRFLSYAKVGKEVTVTLPGNKKVEGIIQFRPHFAHQLPPGSQGYLQYKGNRIIIIIKLIEKLPIRYYINDAPVKVNFNF
ncbi:MAG: hypothetical protein COB66_07555, partial [Coxiella sp. (in: Bacteria)]